MCSAQVQKMSYLTSLVPVLQATGIRDFQLTDTNYEVAINMLQERDGDKDLLISTLMKKLLNV